MRSKNTNNTASNANPATLIEYNDQPKAKDDIYKIVAQSEPKDVVDAAAPKACKLETYEATPSYEM